MTIAGPNGRVFTFGAAEFFKAMIPGPFFHWAFVGGDSLILSHSNFGVTSAV